MIATIAIFGVIMVVLFFAGFIYLAYSFISSHTIMNNDTMKTKALDVFLYLGIAISLIVSITNFLQILFAAINIRFVDVLNSFVNYDSSSSDVRFAIASLIVMFPVYILLSTYVAKDIQKFLYKQDIVVRKIMIYLTLFITILTLIGTLVSVIYTYLGGELSIRFGLKAGAVFVVALLVFGYYLYSLKRNYANKTIVPFFAAIVAILAVLASLFWSISMIGTPAQMRAKKIDSTRLSDISRVQQELLNRFQSTDKLPINLSELDNAFQGYTVPTDPITKVPYVYKVVEQPTFRTNFSTNKKELVTPAIFELCATFETTRHYDARGKSITMPTGVDNGGALDSAYSVSNYYYDGDQSPFWNHDIGETCFKRIISSDMYYGK